MASSSNNGMKISLSDDTVCDSNRRHDYTIRIPSLDNMEKYSDPVKFDEPKEIKSVVKIELTSHFTSIELPQRLGANAFKEDVFNVCASPECRSKVVDVRDHLNLCKNHIETLNKILSDARESLNIAPVSSLKDAEVHKMAYQSLLPSINQILKDIEDANGSKQRKRVKQVLLAFKATIYLYRMYLNPWPDILKAIIEMFLHALKQSEETMKTVAQQVLNLIIIIFFTFNISIIFVADLLLQDDGHLAIGLIGGGGATVGFGVTSLLTTGPIVGGTVVAGPFIAIGAGTAALGIGLFMLIKRIVRSRPHPIAVQVHIMLNEAHAYLRQQIRRLLR